jgi:ubiquinone/menaquinone biosynthesis C-methylase UbiE
MAPIFSKLVRVERPETLIDAGCGVGILTRHLNSHVQNVVGIDPSHESIEIAKKHYQRKNIEFITSSLEAFSRNTNKKVDVLTANMVLMDVINLKRFLTSAKGLLRPRGALIFSITHPWFWPLYYGYANEKWFRYEREIIIESPFRISNAPTGDLASTHVHRPLEKYFQLFRSAGFTIEYLKEPMPSPSTMRCYPQRWDFPRYIVGVCRRAK